MGTFSPTSCSELQFTAEVTSLLRSSLLLENLQEWRLLREMCTDCPYCEEVFLMSRLSKPRSAFPHRAGASAPSSLGGFLLNLLQLLILFVYLKTQNGCCVLCGLTSVKSVLLGGKNTNCGCEFKLMINKTRMGPNMYLRCCFNR